MLKLTLILNTVIIEKLSATMCLFAITHVLIFRVNASAVFEANIIYKILQGC